MREWGRNEQEAFMRPWGQTTWHPLTDIRCAWTLFPGFFIGAQTMWKLMIHSSGLQSFWSISLLIQPNKKTALMRNATSFMLIWLDDRRTVPIWSVARLCQVCWDTVNKDHYSLKMEAWTFLIALTRWSGIVQGDIICLERSLLPCYCAIPSRDFSLTFTCSGNGTHTAQRQLIHSMWDWAAHKGIRTRLLALTLTFDEAVCSGWIFMSLIQQL